MAAHLGCANGESGTTATKPTKAATPADPVDLEAGLSAVLAARDIGGQVVGPAKDEQTVTALVVFASWCNPCRNEIAVLGELASNEPRLRVIGVNAYEEFDDFSDEAKLRTFLAGAAPWLQVVRADDALMDALGRPRKIPCLFLFDADGTLVQTYLRAQRDPPTRDELHAAITRVLNRPIRSTKS